MDAKTRGKQNKSTGKMFESYIEASCRWYETVGMAKIEKQQEPMRMVRPLQGGKCIACRAGKAGVDFKGTKLGGIAVVFEAKCTVTQSMAQSQVKPHQLEYLKAHQRLGADTFVLISFGLLSFYKIPTNVWADMKSIYGKVSVREKDIQEYKVEHQGKVVFFLGKPL